jgi:methyltransferase OMS1
MQAAAAFAALPLIHPRHAAASPDDAVDQIRRDYDGYAASYDDLDGGAVAEALGFPDQRAALLARARGDVLECAVGTGLNLQFYDVDALRSFTAIDISPGMLAQAQRKAEAALRLGSDALDFRTADVAALPFPDVSFDCVVDTFSLCVFPDPGAALKSMARVLRPGGRALLLEHSRSQSPLLGWYQDVTAEPVAAMGKGCVWNQDVPALVWAAGLRVERVDSYLGGLVLAIEAVRDA